MAKRPLTKSVKRRKTGDSLEPLRAALRKRGKEELIDVVVELARDSRAIRHDLETRFKVEPPDQELAADTRQAIADATDFDDRDVNHNFDYDYRAYETVKRNFQRLIETGHLDTAMELSLELMRQGSYQVEMSDEGLMTDDIKKCLQVVTRALGKSALPPPEVVAWCDAMQKQDRVGFVANDELGALRKRFGR